MINIPRPPAPYTDFANQFQRGAPGVVPTGKFQIPQATVRPPNGGIGVPGQMQSGLNANDYTFQARIIDLGTDRSSGIDVENQAAMSVKPFSSLQPHSLIFVNPTRDVFTLAQSARTIGNAEDQPINGCCLEYLMDNPHSELTYTAFERAMNPLKADNAIAYSMTVNIANLPGGSVDDMVKMGLLLPSGDKDDMEEMLTGRNKQLESQNPTTAVEEQTLQKDMTDTRDKAVKDLQTARKGIAKILEFTELFDKWRPDGPTLWSSRSDFQNKELDDAAGTSVFSNVVEGHAVVAELTTALKCKVMDTVYIVIRAIVTEDATDSTKIVFTKPEVCILTSRQLQKAFKNADYDLENLGNELRKPTVDGGLRKVARGNEDKYVVLGGWKIGRVVDLHAVPAAAQTARFAFKGVSHYEIMCNIEQCTAFELIRHLM